VEANAGAEKATSRQVSRRSFFMAIRMARSSVDCLQYSGEESGKLCNERVTATIPSAKRVAVQQRG
jgi:hypothetical protein